jgi:hypothetical protein
MFTTQCLRRTKLTDCREKVTVQLGGSTNIAPDPIGAISRLTRIESEIRFLWVRVDEGQERDGINRMKSFIRNAISPLCREILDGMRFSMFS